MCDICGLPWPEVALDLWVHWGKRANAELMAYDLDIENADAYKTIEFAVKQYGFDVAEDRLRSPVV